MAEQQPIPAGDALAARLAELEEQLEQGAGDAAVDATVTNLKSELDTIARDLLGGAAKGQFEDESECGRVTEMVKAFGHDPEEVKIDSVAGADAGKEQEKADDAPALGHLGKYELLTKIGEGGMGAVYKARHAKLDKIVAIKVLPADKMKDEQAVARFEREMRAVGKLEHPNIVRAMDAGEVDGMHFLVMEYVKGLDLSQISRQHGPLPINAACELIRQAAVGLDEAFDNDMVHRDIKPSNLILASRRRKPPVVKILDMGLALLSDAHAADAGLTTTGQMMGTLDYMAPEQGGDSKSVDIRADIYALGASLYRLLTGEVIYHGEKYTTPVQKMMALAVTPAPPIQERREGIPDELAAIVHRMLEKDPDARNATPQEIADDLAPFCAGADLTWLLTGERTEPSTDSSLSATELGASSSELDTDMTAARPSELTEAGEQGASAPWNESPSADPSAMTMAPIIQTEPKAKPPAAKTQPALRRTIPTNLLIAGGAGLLGIVAVLAAMVIFFQTPNGTLRVEINDPDIEVKVKGEDIVLTGANKEPIKLKAGEHTLIVTRDDFTFETKQFILRKGETTVVKVDVLPGKVQVVSAGTVIGSRDIDSTNVLASNQRARTALLFDGERSYVDIPTLKFDGTHSLTLEAYVTPNRPGRNANVIGDHSGRGVTLRTSGNNCWTFGVGPHPTTDNATPDSQLTVGRRIHLAATWDQRRLRLFVDGKEMASAASTNRGYQPSTRWFAIGRYTSGGGHFSGIIDEVRVSSIARYTEEFVPQEQFEPDKSTLALYHFDEGSGDVLHDSSGNNHHGKIVGAKWVRVGDEALNNVRYALTHNGGSDARHVTAPVPLNVDEDFCIEGWILPSQKEHTGGQLAIFPEVAELIVDNQFSHLAFKGGPRTQLYFRQAPVEGRAHVAFVKHDQTACIYLNGNRIDESKYSPQSPVVVLDSMVIGNRGVGIDEFRVSQFARYKADFTPQERFDADEHTLALYHFDEGSGDVLKDSSGNNHHGKIVGAKWVRVDLGPSSASSDIEAPAAAFERPSRETSLYFSKTEDEVVFPTLFDKSDALTIEAWVQRPADAVKAHSQIVGFDGLTSVCTSSNNGLCFQIPDNAVRAPGFKWNDRHTSPGVAQPVHIAGVRDPNSKELRLYLDGTPVDTSSGAIVRGSSFLKLAGSDYQWSPSDGGPAPSFTGWIDELRISNSVRYTQKFQPSRQFTSDSDTLALYHFDEGEGDVLNDSSGNNHHGKIVGAKWVRLGSDPSNAPPPAVAPFDAATAMLHQQAWANYLGVPVEKEIKLSGGQKLSFMLIPPGEFTIGSSDDEQAQFRALPQIQKVDSTWYTNEGPQRKFDVKEPFYLGKHEVTVAQWTSVQPIGEGIAADNGDQTPVGVSWDMAQVLVESLNKNLPQPNLKFALPMEEQWEYACRAGSTTAYFFADSPDALGEYALFDRPEYGSVQPVGQLEPNPWRLYDILGNANEWCSNLLVDGKPERVLRGGGHDGGTGGCRSAARFGAAPNALLRHYGVRLMLTINTDRLGVSLVPATDADRSAAEWVFEIGGSVKISTAEVKDQMVTKSEELPEGKFHVTIVDLHGAKEVDDASLIRLAALPQMHALRLTGVPIADKGLTHLADCKTLNYLAIDREGTSAEARAALTEALPGLRLQVSE